MLAHPCQQLFALNWAPLVTAEEVEQSPGDLLNTTLRCELQRDSLKENRQTNSAKVTVFRAFVFLQGSKEEKHLEA